MTQPDRYTGGDAGIPPVTIQDEVHVVVSDMHLSEGAVIVEDAKIGYWRRIADMFRGRFHCREVQQDVIVQNPLEDFPHDHVFATFLEDIWEQHKDIPHLRLRMLGDIFDALAVRWKGKFVDSPYEEVARHKMERIILGHSVFFDALALFLRRPRVQIDIFVGNHDQFLVWGAVQEAITERLCGDDDDLRQKLRFVDQSMGFTDVHRRVLYYHGMNAEPSNEIDPKNCILKHRFGVPLPKPILNMPFGSYMTIRIVNAIKRRNPFVGRLHKYSDVWKNAALHKWGWAIFAGIALFWTFLHSQLFAFWNIRRKSTIWKTIKIVFATISDDSVDRYATRLLKERDDVDVVVMGHSHEWRRISGPDGTYINTGTWALLLDLVEPAFPRRWRRWPRLEKIWRGFLHFLSTGQIRFAAQLTKLIGFIALVACMITFLALHFPAEEGWTLGALAMSDLKVPIGILLVFVLASGIIRLFAVTPEVKTSLKLTFCRIAYGADESLKADLMEYLPNERKIRECV